MKNPTNYTWPPDLIDFAEENSGEKPQMLITAALRAFKNSCLAEGLSPIEIKAKLWDLYGQKEKEQVPRVQKKTASSK